MYTNKGDMLADKLRLETEFPDAVFHPSRARELQADIDYSNGLDFEFLENTGQLFTSRRGVEILGLDGRRELRTISESILAARKQAVRANTLEPVIEKLMANWEKLYGAKYGINGKMPLDNGKLIMEKRDVLVTEDFNDAVALQRHIKMLAGIDDTTVTRAFRDFAVWFADHLVDASHNNRFLSFYDSPTARRLSASVLRNRHRSPLNAAKGAAFTKFIIFNPIRQLFLQSQQASVYLGLDYGFKYFMSGKGAMEFAGLFGGIYTRTTPLWEATAKSAARSLGMSVEAYTEFVDAYRRSGLPASIDSHQYAMLTAFDRNLGTPGYGGIAMDIFNNTRKLFRAVGFDAGEQIQVATAFLAVRNKWMKNNP
jgi:hypothetical protein